MKAYHGDQAVKEKYVARCKEHMRLDQVIQGTGFDNGRGCFVGCTLDNYPHSQFPVELGFPEWLAHLADRIFEGLPKHEAPQFCLDLLESVKEGVDLEPVKWQLAILRHERQLVVLRDNPNDYARECEKAIQGVIDYCKSELNGAATASSAASAADSASYQWERDTLLQLIRELKVPIK